MLTESQLWIALEEVMDPEIPTISLVDLGIVTSIELLPELSKAKVTLIPTFSGCPALKVMEELVSEKLSSLGLKEVEVETNFDTAWTTDRITEKGRKALLRHGLAPPPPDAEFISLTVLSEVACPYCNSRNTELKSPFGPTLCRSLHYCNNCLQAFEQFKPVG